MRYGVRQQDLSWREVDGEVVVLDLASSTYFSLNGSGAVLWGALVDGADTDALAQLLVERYGLAPDVAAVDAAAFLESCVARGIVQ